jgi:hypothetical protein
VGINPLAELGTGEKKLELRGFPVNRLTKEET